MIARRRSSIWVLATVVMAVMLTVVFGVPGLVAKADPAPPPASSSIVEQWVYDASVGKWGLWRWDFQSARWSLVAVAPQVPGTTQPAPQVPATTQPAPQVPGTTQPAPQVPVGAGGPQAFVDCNAPAGGTGQQNAPFRSPGEALRGELAPRTTVLLRNGCSWDGAVVVRGDGVTLTGYGDGPPATITATQLKDKEQGAVTLQSRGGVVTGLIVKDAPGAGVTLAAEGATARAMWVENTGFGVRFTAPHTVADGVYARDLHLFTSTPKSENAVDDSGAVGFNVETTDVTVQNSACVRCRAPSDDYGHDGGFIEIWREGDRLRALNNVGYHVDGFLEIGGMPNTGDDVRDVLLQGNRVSEVYERGLYINEGGPYDIPVSGVVLRDNVMQIHGSATAGDTSGVDLDQSNRMGSDVPPPVADPGRPGASGGAPASSSSPPSQPSSQPTTQPSQPSEAPSSSSSSSQAMPSDGGDAVQLNAYVTAYDYYDNTPNNSDRISHPVLHQTAGGVGTYEDPVTVAVGHMKNGGDASFLDHPKGTRFYFPLLQVYGVVEDTCGDGERPEDGPCHRLDTPNNSAPAGAQTWLDVWIDGRDTTPEAARDRMAAVSGGQVVVKNPPAGYPVRPGPVGADLVGS